jgi:hypothetical protein
MTNAICIIKRSTLRIKERPRLTSLAKYGITNRAGFATTSRSISKTVADGSKAFLTNKGESSIAGLALSC